MKTQALCLFVMVLAIGVQGQKTSTYVQERYILLPEEAKITQEALPPNVKLDAQRLEPIKGFAFYTHNGITWVLPSTAVKGRSIRIETGRSRPKSADLTFRYCSCADGQLQRPSNCELALNEEGNFGCTGHCNNQGRLVPCAAIDRHLTFLNRGGRTNERNAGS